MSARESIIPAVADSDSLPAADTGKRAVRNPAGPLHATGRARFLRDEPKPHGLCVAVPLPSPHAHAKIISLDTHAAQRAAGVIAVLTAADVPGELFLNARTEDEPLLPHAEVSYVGQPVALVVAESEGVAYAARELIAVEYKELPALLSIDKALAARSHLGPDYRVQRGDVEKALANSEFVLEGVVENGSQEHVYFEPQYARAIPGEDQEITLYSATQAPSEVQETAARVLGLNRKDITVDVRRIGGGFGGKEAQATLWACLAALACFRTRRPVELKLSRVEDMAWTGKRHPFKSRYRVGFDSAGLIQAYEIEFAANGGAFADLTIPIVQRAIVHAENAYYIPHISIVARSCRTHLPPNTAFRGFGAPQGIFVIETVIERIARHLGKDSLAVRKLNAYRDRQRTPYGQILHEVQTLPMLKRLEQISDYANLQKDVAAFNATHVHCKRGIGVVPVKFGISFNATHLNQAAALIQVYTDGSVSVSHGGVDMGQGLNTKIAQVAAAELGVPLQQIRVESHNTKRTANTSATAASTGADLNGAAVRDAARQIKSRLTALAAELLTQKAGTQVLPFRLVFRRGTIFDPRNPDIALSFTTLADAAWHARIDLCAHGYYRTPGLKFDWKTGRGTPFRYFVYGCGLVVAEVDTLTGMVSLPAVYIVHETARSLNRAVDQGQIEGAFMQCFGWCTMEEVVQDSTGHNLAGSLSTYKIPTFRDLPAEWHIELVESGSKLAGIAGSKAVGEPPFIYGEAVFFAIRHAIEAITDYKVAAELRHPATPEAILTAIEALRQA
jgi:xanthine dehydrogenase large subunit